MKAIRGRLLELLLASATDYAIVALDLHGQVTVWNEGAFRILGWTEEEMLGRSAKTFFTEEDCRTGIPEAEMRTTAETGHGTDERWHVRRDDSRFWAAGEMMPLKDEDGTHVGYVKILRDRTAQRLDAERQRAESEFLRSVLASSGDCIKVLDLDAKLVFMSEGGQRVMEVSDFNAIQGCLWPDFWRGETNLLAREAVETAKAGGIGRFQGEAETMAGNMRHWDVQVTPILGADGKPERLLSISRDVTAAIRAERALREASGINTLVLESSHDCILILDPDGNTCFVSPGGIRAMEVTDVGSVIGQSWLCLWKQADHAAARDAVAEARAGRIGRFKGFCLTLGGTPKWWDVAISPFTAASGATEGLVVIARDITEQHRAETLLRDADERRRMAVEAADIGIWSFDVGTLEVHWDGRCKALVGLPEDAAVSYDVFANTIHQEDRAEVLRVTHAALDPTGTGAYQAEYRVIGVSDGIERWVSATGRARCQDGRPVSLVGTARDISVRKRAEEQAKLLADELQHRVKNTLSMVQAIVRQTLRGAATPAEAQAAIDPRLTSLARAHERLTSGGWEGSDLLDTARDALQPYDDISASRFDIKGPPAWLPSQAAMSLALMLNELATNAAKYGALSTQEGRVELSWTLQAAGAQDGMGRLELLWRERGGPAVRKPERRGFGSRLIERGLASALGGKAALAFDHDGLTCRVEGNLAAFKPPSG